VPIIICSGTVRRRDSVLGLKLGADDFIPKPFEPAEFEARVEAVLRRTQASRMAATPATAASPQRLRVGALEMDHALQRATLGGLPLALTPTEFRLLLALASRPNTVLSREELARHVWGDHQLTSARAIDVHVFRLREKLTRGPETSPTLVSVRSFGYQLSTEAATPGFAAAC
jgi:two-component system alkaline phosphatase synthesis response regulator PhoP